jgi:serine/threonine-protein kinase
MLIGTGDSETVKVLDFGIAHRDDTRLEPTIQTSSDSLLGTPQYMAPEQALGDPVDARADIYTLGLICYEMIAGQPAFKGGRREALICRQISENPPLLKEFRANVPALLEVTVRKAIDKKPRRRHQTAQELADDFRRALAAARMLAGTTSGHLADDSDTPALSLLSVGLNTQKVSQAQSFDQKPESTPLVTEVKPYSDEPKGNILVTMPATAPDNNLVRWIGPALLVIGGLVLLSILGYKVLEGIGIHISR